MRLVDLKKGIDIPYEAVRLSSFRSMYNECFLIAHFERSHENIIEKNNLDDVENAWRKIIDAYENDERVVWLDSL